MSGRTDGQTERGRERRGRRDGGEGSRFSLNLTGVFFKETLYPIYGEQDVVILLFLSHIGIVIFDAEHIYSKQNVTNFKIRQGIANPKPQNRKQIGLSKTLNHKPKASSTP